MPPGGKSEANLDLVKLMLDEIRESQKPVLYQVQQTNTKVDTINTKVDVINGRLIEGDKRLDEHDAFREYALPLLERCKTGKHDREDDTTTTVIRKKDKLHWAVILVIGGACTWVGERGIHSIINGLADKPAVTAPAPVPTPTHP